MNIIQREFHGQADMQAMAALVRDFPTDDLHVSDLPYRFSSWALDDPGNIGFWFGLWNQLLAWAILQSPFGSGPGHHLRKSAVHAIAWSEADNCRNRQLPLSGDSALRGGWFSDIQRDDGLPQRLSGWIWVFVNRSTKIF